MSGLCPVYLGPVNDCLSTLAIESAHIPTLYVLYPAAFKISQL